MNNQDKPAYPLVAGDQGWLGLTKLEAFTMAAMQGLVTDENVPIDDLPTIAANLAKATLAELEKTND